MTALIVTGALAGIALGVVFQRSDLCFHSTWRGLFEKRYGLFQVWIVGVALASVGLSAVYGLDRWDLNQGLALRPLGNVLGGATIGVAMVVTASCVTGLFYKLGSGMLGAVAGLAAWFVGDVAGHRFLVGRDGALDLRGPVAELPGGPTVPEVLGVSRWLVSVLFALVVLGVLVAMQRRSGGPRSSPWVDGGAGRRWLWPLGGVALALATTLGWVLAGVGGTSFGPSTVGAPASIVDGEGVDVWQVSFLGFLIVGAALAAIGSDTVWVRGETARRVAQLALGGFLLGVGGQIGGGCNLGHGLSGTAQLNVSSWLTVAAIVVGIGAARSVGQ